MDRDPSAIGWKALVIRGAIGIVFGLLAIAWPISTALALMMLWGFWALAEGVGALVQAFGPEPGLGSPALVLIGIAGLIAAFFAIFSPAVTATTLTWIIGVWLILRGVFEAVTAFSSPSATPRWLLLLGAALSIALGLFFVANPGRGAVGIALLLGSMAMLWGVVFVAAGLLLRAGADRGGVGRQAVG